MMTASTTLYQIKAVASGIGTYEVECLGSNGEVEGRDIELGSRSVLERSCPAMRTLTAKMSALKAAAQI